MQLILVQILTDLPSKELRNIVDQGKKEIKTGIIIERDLIKNRCCCWCYR